MLAVNFFRDSVPAFLVALRYALNFRRIIDSKKQFGILVVNMRKIVVFLIVTLLYSAPCFAGKRFTFVTVDFPPYYGEELPEYGWVSEIARKALEIKGYEVEIRFIPWVKALEGTQDGDYDALLGAYRTHERDELYYFSLPVGQVRIGFFKRKTDDISFKDLTELKEYKIGVVNG
jgi:polar amino acid transport system substrate-binding protein